MIFNDKVVLVTGSSRGIGKEIIRQFAKCGAKVVVNYVNSEFEANSFKDELISKYNSDVLVVQADVSVPSDVDRLIKNTVSKFGKIDILVNNASICNDCLFDEKTVSGFNKVLGVNLIGTYLVSNMASKYMKKGSKIINISSDNGIDRYYPESCEYDASKAGVISLTHNMARFYAPDINVNCVCPGWIDTDMNQDLSDEQKKTISEKILVNRFGSVCDIANVVLFLASDNANYINDSIIKVNGGIKND